MVGKLVGDYGKAKSKWPALQQLGLGKSRRPSGRHNAETVPWRSGRGSAAGAVRDEEAAGSKRRMASEGAPASKCIGRTAGSCSSYQAKRTTGAPVELCGLSEVYGVGNRETLRSLRRRMRGFTIYERANSRGVGRRRSFLGQTPKRGEP